jgi:putative transcriptional regulator
MIFGMKTIRNNYGPFLVFLALFMMVPALPDAGSGFSPHDEEFLASQMPAMPPLPYQNRSKGTLSKGKFLVAGRDMRDPRFAETVILLVEYGSNGATGLIVNRPTEVKLSSVLSEMKGLESRKDIVYIGGPVSQGQMLMLIQSRGRIEESRHVFQDIYVSGSQKVLEGMIGKKDTGKRFRVYAGYSGWAPQQLERELGRGDWHIVEADVKTIFDKESSEIWPELIQRGTAQWVRAGEGPLI